MTDSKTVHWYTNNPDSPEAKAALSESIGKLYLRIDELEDKEKERATREKVILSVLALIFGIVEPLIIWYITK